jgi:hypothetical protein
MKPENQQIVESIKNEFSLIYEDERIVAAILIILSIANQAGDSYCETLGIIDSVKDELRESLTQEKPEFLSAIEIINRNHKN